jgi:hypothetical protein
VAGGRWVPRLRWQHGDLGARLLDELLQVDLTQLLGELLQLLVLVLQKPDPRERSEPIKTQENPGPLRTNQNPGTLRTQPIRTQLIIWV